MFPYLVYVSVASMGKIVIGVLVGVYVSPRLSAPIESEKGLSFITLRVLLSAMLFSNVCFDVSLTLLSKYYWAVIMSLVPMILGGLMSVACTRLVSREYRCLVVLGSTFQNGLVFPLTVVTSIKGVAWLDDEAVRHCQQFVFLYNLTCALGLWSIGSPMVKHYKDKYENEKMEAEAEADYLSSLLVFYKRIVQCGKTDTLVCDGTAAAVAAQKDRVVNGDEGVYAAAGTAVQQLDDLIEHTKRTSHTSLRDMTIFDVLGEFMYRIRAARGGSAAGNARTAAVLMPPASTSLTLYDAAKDEKATSQNGARSPVVPDGAQHKSDIAAITVQTAVASAVSGDAPSAVPPTAAAGRTKTTASKTTRLKVDALDEDDENGGGIPETDAGRQLVLYRPLSGTGKMRPIDTHKFDVWQSRQRRYQHEAAQQANDDDAAAASDEGVGTRSQTRAKPNSTTASQGHARRAPAAADRADVGAGASALFTPVEDVYQDTVTGMASFGAHRQKRSKSKEPFTYAYVSTIGNIVYGCCRGGDSSDDEADRALHAADAAGLPRNVELRERDRPCSYRFRKFLKAANGAFQTMPVWATLLAICISLVPPLRWLAETVPCAMVIQGLHIVGEGCVPVQLVVLGCTLATKRLVGPLVLQRTDKEMREKEARRPETLVQRLTLAKLRHRVLHGLLPSQKKSGVRGANHSETVMITSTTAAAATTTALPCDTQYKEGESVDAEMILHAQPSASATLDKPSHADSAVSGPLSSATSGVRFEGLDWVDRDTLDLLATGGTASFPATTQWTWWDRVPSATRLAIIVMVLRLIVVPAISFFVVHLLMSYQIMPTDRPFVVSILIGISSPAAVNSSLACTMHGYHANEYSRVMFVMHVAAIVTSTFWLVVSIMYTEKMGTDLYR